MLENFVWLLAVSCVTQNISLQNICSAMTREVKHFFFFLISSYVSDDKLFLMCELFECWTC